MAAGATQRKGHSSLMLVGTRQICKRRGFLDFDGHLIVQQTYWTRLHQVRVKCMFFVRSGWLLYLVN